MRMNLQFFGGRGAGSAGGGGAVTPTSIPNRSIENIQKFVDQFGTGITVEQMVNKVYSALPNIGTSSMMGGVIGNKGASIVNGRYLQIGGGSTLQFIRQKSKGTWKVKTM